MNMFQMTSLTVYTVHQMNMSTRVTDRVPDDYVTEVSLTSVYSVPGKLLIDFTVTVMVTQVKVKEQAETVNQTVQRCEPSPLRFGQCVAK